MDNLLITGPMFLGKANNVKAIFQNSNNTLYLRSGLIFEIKGSKFLTMEKDEKIVALKAYCQYKGQFTKRDAVLIQ